MAKARPREEVEPPELRPMALRLAANWTSEPPEFVRNFANLVYRIRMDGEPAYLRITSSARRSRAQVSSELAMIQHLTDRGVSVARPIEGGDGQLLAEDAADGSVYVACVFEEAIGNFYERADTATETAFFSEAGRTLARIHNGLDTFKPDADFERFPWRADLWHEFEELVPKREVAAWTFFDELNAWVSSLDANSPAFGLIQGDFTIMNLRILPRRVTAFDFDASCEHWRAYDIACFLHFFGARPERERMLAYGSFLSGYAEARMLDRDVLEQIPMFGKMRLLYSYLVFAKEWGFENLTPEQERYFEVRRRLFVEPPTWPGS